MPISAQTGRPGYLHEAVLYDSDEEFLGVVVPFLQGGVAAGEPCLVASARRAAGSSGRPWGTPPVSPSSTTDTTDRRV
jgi:hypothetical protein